MAEDQPPTSDSVNAQIGTSASGIAVGKGINQNEININFDSQHDQIIYGQARLTENIDEFKTEIREEIALLKDQLSNIRERLPSYPTWTQMLLITTALVMVALLIVLIWELRDVHLTMIEPRIVFGK